MSITEQNGLSHYFIVRQLFNEIEKCSYSSGISTRIAIAILGAQSAGFALFNEIEKCTYSRSVKGME